MQAFYALDGRKTGRICKCCIGRKVVAAEKKHSGEKSGQRALRQPRGFSGFHVFFEERKLLRIPPLPGPKTADLCPFVVVTIKRMDLREVHPAGGKRNDPRCLPAGKQSCRNAAKIGLRNKNQFKLCNRL
ncbi:hypothetical protein [Salaquimonas pukyongi]|uniref:hypothetical protein n=1 Tax=Salaquimonas pukyongi TaxID=2712698 RepID=UPI0013BE8EFE|nr:hypothetical protein [Salaquimonas pukyongi]